MRGGPVLLLLPAALVLLASTALALPAEPWDLRPSEPLARDTYVQEGLPGANFGAGPVLAFGEVEGNASRALIAFDLAGLPRNATLLGATLELTLTEPTTLPRSATVAALAAPFVEGEVTWATRPATGADLATANVTSGGEGLAWDLTAALRGPVERGAPWHGVVVRGDAPPLHGPLLVHSSAAADAATRPVLRLRLERNGPTVANLTFDGATPGPTVPAGPGRALAVRAEAADPGGTVVDVRFVVEDAGGVPLRNVSLARDNSTFAGEVTLDLPNGTYRATVLAKDSDGLWARLDPAAEARVLVERTPPHLELASAASSVIEADATHLPLENRTLELRANASDASGLAEVVLRWQDPAGRLVNATMSPLGDGSIAYAWQGQRAGPGKHRFTIEAVDRAGNRNTTSGEVGVLDRTAPRVADLRPEGAAVRGEALEEEAGGSFGVLLALEDESPVLGRLVVLNRTGEEVASTVLARDASTGRFRGALDVPEEGDYTWHVASRSFALDGTTNDAASPPRPLRVVAAGPPAVQVHEPGDGAWVRAAPVLAAEVFDHNLDPINLSLDVLVDGAPVAVATRVGLEAERARVALGPLAAPHGALVEAILRARDTLGQDMAPFTWSFRVDAEAPASRLGAPRGVLSGAGSASFGPTLLTVDRGTAGLGLEADDDGSGVAAVRWRWTRVGSGTGDGFHHSPGPVDLDVAALGDGLWRLDYAAVDRAGNEEPLRSALVLRDATAPRLAVREDAGRVVARALDDGAGLVRMALRAKTSGPDAMVDLAAVPGEPGAYAATLPPGAVGWWVEAIDAAGHARRFPPGDAVLVTAAAANRPPEVLWLAPPDLASLGDTAMLRWRATDADGDLLRLTLHARPLLGGAWQVIEAGGAGQARWDTGAQPNGPWELRLRVRDALGATAEATRTVVLANPGRNATALVFDLLPASLRAGAPNVVSARVAQPVSEVWAVLRQGDREVRGSLRDDGQLPDLAAGDGNFTGLVAFPDRGAWEAGVGLRHRDGHVETIALQSYLVRGDLVAAPGGVLLLGVLAVGAGLRSWSRRRGW